MSVLDQKEKDRIERSLFRKLESRSRLMGLLSDAKPARERPELARLRDYLTQWASYERGYRENLGAESAEPLAHQPTCASAAGEYLERSDRMAMQTIDTCVTGLAELPEGVKMVAALRIRYLNEIMTLEIGRLVAVFRSNRLAGASQARVDELADSAEDILIPWVRRRGLPL